MISEKSNFLTEIYLYSIKLRAVLGNLLHRLLFNSILIALVREPEFRNRRLSYDNTRRTAIIHFFTSAAM